MNKTEILCLVFSKLKNVIGTLGVHLALDQQRDVVCEFFALLCFVLLGAAPIPYRHPL